MPGGWQNGFPMRFRYASLLPLALAGCATPAMQSKPAAPTLRAETYGAQRPSSVATVIVVLHGDASADHYQFAETAARAIPGSVAVALLRPGYTDAAGRQSPGVRGNGTGDNYTTDRIAAVSEAIAALRRRYDRARVVLVGDSGGAAIAANIAGIRPGLIDGMVLVGCPCTLPEWRRHMQRRAPGQAWNTAVTSLDPLKTAGGIPPTLRVAVLVGANDKETPIPFSRAYAEALTLRGIATDYRIVPGKGHDLLGDPEVLAATRRLAAALPKRG